MMQQAGDMAVMASAQGWLGRCLWCSLLLPAEG